MILALFTKFGTRGFSFFFSSAIILIIFGTFLISRIHPLREIKTSQILPDLLYVEQNEKVLTGK